MVTKGWMAVTFAFLLSCQASSDPLAGKPRAGFESDTAGGLPAGFVVASTGQAGPHASWMVRADAAAGAGGQVLSLTTQNHTNEDAFNLCWNAALRFRDGTLGVLVRADAGVVDQGGGLAWRIQDANNYYVCRYNPLESNYRVYVVRGGVRRQLATAIVPGDGKGWHALAVEQRGERITCWIDGKKLLEASDAALGSEGGVGFWTKADARTSFDDLVVAAAR